jgi:hypothetical protein
VLLKCGDHAMALVAAERSTQCGLDSTDPVAVGASARIMTHALMGNGHSRQAVTLAQTAAVDLEQATQLGSIEAAHTRSWTAAVTATSSALPFLDLPAIEELTANPVRSSYQTSVTGRRALPSVDAVIIAPATYNTINKLALGVADSYPLATAAELIGRGIPTVIVPFVNAALAARAPFQRALVDLRGEGIRVLSGPDHNWEPHPPGTGSDTQALFPWQKAFQLAEQAGDRRMHP